MEQGGMVAADPSPETVAADDGLVSDRSAPARVAGIRSVKRVPLPGPSLVQVTSPPWARAMPRQIERPRPNPWGREPSETTWLNGSKSRGRSWGEIPGPESVTLAQT